MTPGPTKPLWRPSAESVEAANMTAFMRLVHSRHCANVADYAALHQWSIDHLEDFWSTLWDYAGIVAQARGETVLAELPGTALPVATGPA